MREILKHVENISRTMTMIRRLLWSFVVISVLSVVLLGYLTLKAKRQSEGFFRSLEQLQENRDTNTELNLDNLLKTLK